MGANAYLSELSLADFRCFETLDLELTPGLTVFVGDNGHGKTSVLESIGWPAHARSIRGAPDSALVRHGCDVAILRCVLHSSERPQSFEAEIKAVGRNRILVNRQALTRTRDLYGFMRVTTFAPDDLQLVKAGPAGRRAYLDDLLVMLGPRYGAAASDYDRVLRQRNALLKSAARERLDMGTLAVFNEQLVSAGAEIVRGRIQLLERLQAPAARCYQELGEGEATAASYQAEWLGRPLSGADLANAEALLREAIEAKQRHEIDRQVTLVGPHRDDVHLQIGGLDARTHASQGEQRSLALALRLAGHDVVTALSEQAPVLLLDDVFSELDARRSEALVSLLPAGQTLLTTAGVLPQGVHVDRRLRVSNGKLTEE